MWCKEEAYKKENTKETVKCWNLEHLIEAEMLGRQVPETDDYDTFVQKAMHLNDTLLQVTEQAWGWGKTFYVAHNSKALIQ